MAICVLYGVKSIPFVGGRVHHLIDSLASLLRTKRSDLNAFITAIWSGHRNIRPNCTKIALPKNLWAKARLGLESRVRPNCLKPLILSSGRKALSSFVSHRSSRYSKCCLGSKWHFLGFLWKPAFFRMSSTSLVWRRSSGLERASTRKSSR